MTDPAAETACRVLEDEDWINKELGNSTGGRPRAACYWINPAVLGGRNDFPETPIHGSIQKPFSYFRHPALYEYPEKKGCIVSKWLAMLGPEATEEPLPPKVSEPTYHSLTPAELEAEAADDWQEIQNDPGQLEAFAHAITIRRMRESGQRPAHYTKAAECERCGPVWLWEGAPDRVQGCPWCLNKDTPIPRPAPVQCRDCHHWIPDTINPVGGLGQCGMNVPGLAWPTRKLKCDKYAKVNQ